jgi:hypothetical protein
VLQTPELTPPSSELIGAVGSIPAVIPKSNPPPNVCPLTVTKFGTPLLARKMPAEYQPPMMRLLRSEALGPGPAPALSVVSFRKTAQ